MKKPLLAVTFMLALLSVWMAVPMTAFADGAPIGLATVDLDGNPDGFLKSVVDAVMNKNWGLVASLVMLATVFVLRKEKLWITKKVPWFNTDRGGTAFALGIGILGTLGASLGAGAKFTPELVTKAVSIAVGGIGIFTIVTRLLWPPDKKEGEAAPAPPAA